jgi:hypothetical protein
LFERSLKEIFLPIQKKKNKTSLKKNKKKQKKKNKTKIEEI